MKYLKQIYISSLTGMLLMGAVSCSDEINTPGSVPDGTTGITLRIPNPESAASFDGTRADGQNEADVLLQEGKINKGDLWLLAYAKDAPDANSKRIKLTNPIPADKELNSSAYTDYSVTLNADKYDIFVVANLSDYIGETKLESISEDNLKNLLLTFGDKNGQNPLKAGNLPMACLNTNLKTGMGGSIENGIVDLSQGDNITINADLTFLCSKVRYTVHFDNNANGVSSVFGSDHFIDFEKVQVENVWNSTYLYSDKTAAEAVFAYEYAPTKRSYDASNKDKTVMMQSVSSFGESDHVRAWQDVVYLPENLSESKKTKLTFNGKIDNTISQNYALVLNDKNTTADKKLKRGKFYDISVSVKNRENFQIDNFNVTDWTLKGLVYTLHGPYSLQVDKTVIDNLKSGEVEKIWFQTDAEGVLGYVSPKLEGTNKDVYKIELDETKDHLLVSINPSLTFEETSSLVGSDGKVKAEYSYFNINAGSLVKKIDVKAIDVAPYCNVTPLTITLDVRELIGSGESSGTYDITAITNLPGIKVEKVKGWSPAANEVLKFTEGSLKSGVMTSTLEFSGIGGGKAFWNESHTLTVEYSALDASGNVYKYNDGSPVKSILTIIVKPYNYDYVIHFRAENWYNPHIYVYQCLEMPADINSAGAGMTVGNGDTNAALQYLFSGSRAFLGWKGYGGPDKNDPYADGSSLNGFWNFNGVGNFMSEDGRYTYIDFNKDYREKLTVCGYCHGEVVNGWPGIGMIYEGDGWWRYELSGIAEPGRTLIMFKDIHGDNSSAAKRTPGSNVVGFPLFDFPSHEGWLNCPEKPGENDRFSFYAEKPALAKDNRQLYRYYWKKNDGTKLNVWKNDGDEPRTIGDKYPISEDGQYYYGEFLASNYESLNFTINDDGKENVSVNSFRTTLQSPVVKCYYKGGQFPSEAGAQTYRIYWDNKYNGSLMNYIYIWNCKDSNVNGHHEKSGTENGKNYFEFKTDKNPNGMSFLVKPNAGDNWTNQSGDVTNISFQSSGSIMVYGK